MKNIHVYRSIDIDEINNLFKNISYKIVDIAERRYNDELKNVVNLVMNNFSKYKIILLAGPSASGKTTTAKLLQNALRASGIGAWVISLDDFFWGKDCIPRNGMGQLDYESINSLDLDLVHKCLEELILTSSSEFPIFDFINDTRSEFKRLIKISDGDILILEGLHALNPELMLPSYINKCLKVYVSVSTSYVKEEKTIIKPSELRLIRRIIRDNKFRNTSPYETLKIWPFVCEGEQKYIDPFKESAKIFIDSCLSYEPFIFNNYIVELLNMIDKSDLRYEEILNISHKLTYFKNIDSSTVPINSILREFIGLA